MHNVYLRQAVSTLFVISLLMPPTHAWAQQPSGATPNEPVVQISAKRTKIEIIERFSKVVELKNNIVRVDGFDPSVLTVSAISPTQIRLQAVTQGVTNVVLTDTVNETYTIDLFIKGDSRHLQALIDAKFADSSIEVLKVGESVVLRGWVSQPEHISQIVDIAEQFYPNVLNHMSVGGVQQIKLRLKVMEVQRAKIRQLGFNWLYLNRNGYLSSTAGQLVQVAETSLPFKPGSPGLLFANETLSESTAAFAITGDSNVFNGFLEALKEESLLKVMSEPELVVTNGRPATLLSGGEFPILVPSGLGTVSIDWREFGTRLEAVPMILGGGRVRLDLQPEFSERDFTNAVDVGGFTVPGLTIRRANTQVEMRFGETLMIAGLISSRETSETDKVPFLGELPWIGAAFRRVRSDTTENELIIMVTPELVAPLSPDQVPEGGPGSFSSMPTDSELFRDGFLEVPRYGDNCEGCEVPVIQSSKPSQAPYVPPAPASVQMPSTDVSRQAVFESRAGISTTSSQIRPSNRSADRDERGGRRSNIVTRELPKLDPAESFPSRSQRQRGFDLIKPGDSTPLPASFEKPAGGNRVSPPNRPGLIEP